PAALLLVRPWRRNRMEQTLDPTNPGASSEDAERETNLSRSERWVSVAGGGALALWGVAQLELGGVLAAGLGGYLVYRGVTGHCPLYRRLGISSLAPRAMELSADARATIGRASDDVYDSLRKPESFAAPMRSLRQVVEE